MLIVLALLLTSAAPPPRNVYVGTYLSDVSDFDLKAGRFKADLRVWVKWLGDDEVPDISFENGEVDSKIELGREHDASWHSVQWRVQGTFRGDFPVHAFPFDRQTLPVIFGLRSSDGVLVPDLGASGMSPSFSITGWSYEPSFSARAEERTYRSDLGSVADEGKDSRQRLAVFSVEMARPFGPYLIKFALPLALILLVALLALLLPAERLDVRSAMGITALLSCIAFHYTQADTLPNVTYLVAADKLFLGAYVFVAATLVLSIGSFRVSGSRPGLARAADRVGLWLLPGISALSLSVLLGTSLSHGAPAREPAPERPSFPVLRVGVAALDFGALPDQRAAMVVRGADGAFRAALADEAPAMTNALVRLLPDGGMRIRWRLREGARWSDDRPITSEDLEFSISAAKEPLRVKVERVDARTVEVTYAARRSEWLAGFTVVPAKGSATSAPWTVSRADSGKGLELARNAHFAGLRPYFERIEVTVMDPLAGARALLEGKIDVLPSLTPDSYELLKDARGVRVLEQPGELAWMLVPQLATPPWNSLDARRALLAALDREAMARDFAPAPTRVAWGWRALPVGSIKASRKLELEGNALGLSLEGHDEVQAQLAKRIVADLAKVGVSVTLVERDDLRVAVQRGDFQGLALLSSQTTDPGRFMNVVGGLDQAAGPHFDDEMVERYEYYQSTLYAERRDFLASAMQEAWFSRLPMLPLVLTSRLSAVRADLQGPEWGQADLLWWNVADWRPR